MIQLRAHHILCLQGFQNKGYDSKFVKNFSEVHKSLFNDPHQKVQINNNLDSLCAACPHASNHQCVKDKTAQRRMLKRDRNTLKVLNLINLQVMTFSQLIDLSRNTFKKFSKLNEICFDCEWQNSCLFYKKHSC